MYFSAQYQRSDWKLLSVQIYVAVFFSSKLPEQSIRLETYKVPRHLQIVKYTLTITITVKKHTRKASRSDMLYTNFTTNNIECIINNAKQDKEGN